MIIHNNGWEVDPMQVGHYQNMLQFVATITAIQPALVRNRVSTLCLGSFNSDACVNEYLVDDIFVFSNNGKFMRETFDGLYSLSQVTSHVNSKAVNIGSHFVTNAPMHQFRWWHLDVIKF